MSNQTDNDDNFLSRWSRRKRDNKQDESSGGKVGNTIINDDEHVVGAEPSTIEQEESVPLWQRDDIDAETRKDALRALFKQPEFNQVDRLNDYDYDFSEYTKLDGLVTRQMKRMLKLAEQKTRPESEPNIPEAKPTTNVAEQPQLDNDTKEDKPLA